MILEGYKAISEYLTVKGKPLQPESVRAAVARHGLPVSKFNGRVAADARELDAWVEQRKGGR